MGVRPGLRADFHGVMVTVHCESFGGRNGLDLARRIDEIISAYDQRVDRNLVDFYSKDYMIAAHVPESFSLRAAATYGEADKKDAA